MKLYTRSGDDGTTGLFGGARVAKSHPRVEAYGGVDELNACIGLAVAALPAADALFLPILTAIQSRLFDLGADLATPPQSKHESKVRRLSAEDVAEAERWIDDIEAGNAPLAAFILPGGTELAARLHFARTVCRRAERAMVHLGHSEDVNPHALVYMNRVSDLLFAMARRANKDAGVSDVPWRSAQA
jgi:cob(I)alamin adenosyltransferase